MAGNFCLPKKYAGPFLQALKDKKLNPSVIRKMSSEARRKEFSKFMDEDTALTVNQLFEEKLLLKDQQKGIVNWVNQMLGNNEPAKRDIVARTQRMQKLLTPKDEQRLLHDLAEKKLGVDVNAAEANKIFELSNRAKELEEISKADFDNIPNRIAWGNAIQDLDDYVQELSPDGRTVANKAFDLLGIPKAISSTGDFSGVGNQGWGMITTGPGVRGIPEMLKYFANEQNLRDLNAMILTDPDLNIMRSAKLGLTDVGRSIWKREETFQSSYVDDASQYVFDKMGIPRLNPIAASTRAYVGYLNYVRYNRMKQLLEFARLAGEDIRVGSQATKDIASVINDFTGRSNIGVGDKWGNAAPLLNAVLWAPRKMISSFAMFSPHQYFKSSATARKAAARQLAGSVLFTGAVLGMAKAAGADIELDPRATKFGQFTFGDTSFDPSGGTRTTLRLMTRIAIALTNTILGTEFNEVVNSRGEAERLKPGFGFGGRGQEVVNYTRGKFSPVASFFTDLIVGQDGIGRPFEADQAVMDRMAPLVFGSFIDLANNDSDNAAAWLLAPVSLFGMGMSSRAPYTREGLTVWGDEPNSDQEAATDELDKALQELGVQMKFPPKAIKGVELTPEQYKAYIQFVGGYTKDLLNEMIRNGNWNEMSIQDRLEEYRNNIRPEAMQSAQEALELNSTNNRDGQDNDIFELSEQKANERMSQENPIRTDR